MSRPRNRALWLGLLLLGVVVAGVAYERLWGGGDDVRIAVRQRLEPPSPAHPFGTDDLGRDVLARVLSGGAIALEVGLVAVGIGLTTGTTLALAAVRWGRWPTRAMGAVMDGLMAFPSILLALAIITVLGAGYVPAMIAIGIGLVPVFWRQTRAQAIAIEGREFVLAARGLGATDGRVLWRHIAPQITPLLVIDSGDRDVQRRGARRGVAQLSRGRDPAAGAVVGSDAARRDARARRGAVDGHLSGRGARGDGPRYQPVRRRAAGRARPAAPPDRGARAAGLSPPEVPVCRRVSRPGWTPAGPACPVRR
jgi:hypothetical protein